MPRTKKKSALQKTREAKQRMAKKRSEEDNSENLNTNLQCLTETGNEVPIEEQSKTTVINSDEALQVKVAKETEKEKDRKRHQTARQDPVYREFEKQKDARSKSRNRKDDKVLLQKRTNDARSKTLKRTDQDYRSQEKEQNKIRTRLSRQDMTARAKERDKDARSKSLKRTDHKYRSQEKLQDKIRTRLSREDLSVRVKKRESDARSKSLRRTDQDYKSQEKEQNKIRNRLSRKDMTARAKERDKDARSKSLRRTDQDFRSQEKERDKVKTQLSRTDVEKRQKERLSDARAKKLKRLNSGFRKTEKINEITKLKTTQEVSRTPTQPANKYQCKKANDNTSENIVQVPSCSRNINDKPTVSTVLNGVQTPNRHRKQTMKHINERGYSAHEFSYMQTIRETPSHVCCSCGGLFYKNAISSIKGSNKGPLNEIIEKVSCIEQHKNRFCATCKRYVGLQKIPRLCLNNGFQFPPIPESLKDLSPLEERLVALRLPFMQIKLLGAERQSILKGNVVNIENDLDICTSVIPRSFDNTSTIQVQLMRRLNDKRPYMYETIRPSKVHTAAEYLIGTELYRKENIKLSRKWEKSGEEDTMDFICDDTDVLAEANSTSEQSLANEERKEETGTSDQPETQEAFIGISDLMGAEECLLLPHSSNLGLKIAPGEGKAPLPFFMDPKAEEMSFPTIYCGVVREFPPELKITYTDIAKSEIRRYDRRACTPTKLLYSFKKSYIEKLRNAVNIHMRKRTNSARLKAKDVRTQELIKNMIRKDESYTSVWSKLRSSPAYWAAKQKTVLAMIRQLGKCHLFITLSAAESKWNELLVYLMSIIKGREINEDEAAKLSKGEKRELIRSDPVSCMRHFDHKLRALTNKLLTPADGVFAPFGTSDYFSRLEFQMRGSPHSHGLYWINGAPEYKDGDRDSEIETIKFIDEFITCERSSDASLQEVLRYQIHKHSDTCFKKRRASKICRFGFPRPPVPSTVIISPLPKTYSKKLRARATELYKKIQDDLTARGRDPDTNPSFREYLQILEIDETDYYTAIRSSVERPSVFLRRQVNEAFINQYNKKILHAWGANMDIQYVLDTYACAKYCVGYILKSDGGMSKLMKAATLSFRKGNHSIQEKIKAYSKIFVNASEVSAQEGAAYLLGIPNTRCSRSEVFINTAPPDERTTILKPQEELNELDDESEDIHVKGLMDHYSKRPEIMESICLADVASLFQYSKSKRKGQCRDLNDESDEALQNQENPNENEEFDEIYELNENSGFLKKRKQRKIIRFVHYGKQLDPINYWREQLTLFVPWRDELEFEGNSVNLAKENMEEILKNSQFYYHSRDIDENILSDLIDESRQDDDELAGSRPEENLFAEDEEYLSNNFLGIENNNRKIDNFLPPRQLPDNEYFCLMQSLNEGQRKFVMNVLHLVKTSKEPFYHFLSGGAGTGKSHAIKAIVQSVMRHYGKQYGRDPNKVAVIVAAPTGMAAFNVNGMTIHGAFRLPPTQNNDPLHDLNDSIRNSVRTLLEDIELFILDEISMVLVRQLYDIDQRLRDVYETDKDFGGKSILVVGHLRQLRPIGGGRAFEDWKGSRFTEITGNHLWPKFTLFELTEIMRQKGEAMFCKALNQMAEGEMDEDDIALIKTCQISDINKPPSTANWLFKTNEQCRFYNEKYFKTLNTEGVMSEAVDILEGKGTSKQRENLLIEAKTLSHMESDGLPYFTFLKVGGKYLICTNIRVADGLFNGAHGTLMAIKYKGIEKKEPIIAWIKFDDPSIGMEARKEKFHLYQDSNIDQSWTPIGRITRKLSKSSKQHSLRIVRVQIPLLACNGMTIAKSQGSSLPSVVVNVSYEKGYEKLRTEDLYVACSRAMSKDGLFINGDFQAPPPYKSNHPVTVEMNRLRELGFNFKLEFLQDISAEFTKIYYHNIQSFKLHQSDILADSCPMSADVLCLVEPHLTSTDQITLPGFLNIFRKNVKSSRHESGGLLVFVKDTSKLIDHFVDVEDLSSSVEGIEICCVKFSSFTCIITYRAPWSSASAYLKTLKDAMQTVHHNFIFLGDVNMDFSKPNRDKNIAELCSLMSTKNATSKLNFEDSSTDGNTHIDVAFSNIQKMSCWFYESYYSYHKPICVYF